MKVPKKNLTRLQCFMSCVKPRLGEEFLLELSESFQRIRKNPFSYKIHFDDFRRHLMERFPYAVFYRVEHQLVTVFAVAHLRRRPGYWEDRAPV